VGLLGTSFFPDTPEAQRRLRDALPLLANGTDEKGVVLELHRREDGRALGPVVVVQAGPHWQLYAQHVHGHHRSGLDGAREGAARGT
jgi:hypothetical protein